jgi:anti-sigma-K factor RskA
MSDRTNDPHDLILDLLPAYALGVLDEPDLAQVERHLATCAACADELRAYEEAAVALVFATAPPAPAPPDLEQRLMERIAQRARQTDRHIAAPSVEPRRSLLDRLWPALRWAVPAAALAIVLLVIALSVQPVRAPTRIRLSGTDSAPGAWGTLTITGETAVLTVAELPPLDRSQQYQLWLVRPDGTRDSGAVFSVAPDGSAEVPVAMRQPPDGYVRYGITVEPAGGSPGPTGPGVLRSDS